MNRKLLLFTIFCLLSQISLANDDIFNLGGFRFETVGDEDKIPGNIITALLQDDQDFMWIGSQKGLIKYDGYNFIRINLKSNRLTSLEDKYIRHLHKLDNGQLVISTFSSGLFILDPIENKLTHYLHDENDTNSLADNRVEVVVGNIKSGIWVGTNNGLDHFDFTKDKFSHFVHDADNVNSINDDHIRSLLISKDDTLWIGTKKGLNLLPNIKTSIDKNFKKGPESLLNNTAYRIFQSQNNKIWIGTVEKGIAWLDLDKQVAAKNQQLHFVKGLSHPWVLSISEISANEIWLATAGGGIAIVNTDKGEVIKAIQSNPADPYSLNMNIISTILIDKSGIIWVGTWGGGLNKVNPTRNVFRTLRPNPSNDLTLTSADIRSIIELDSGQIWFGTIDNGIDIFSPETGLIGGIRSKNKGGPLSDNAIMVLKQFQDKTIWIGTRQAGIYLYNVDKGIFENYTTQNGLGSNSIRDIFQAKDGGIWISTDGGLNKWNVKRNEFSHILIAVSDKKEVFDEVLSIMLQTADGTMWFGSENQLYLLPKNKQIIQKHYEFTDQNGPFSTGRVLSLLLTNNNELWLLTNKHLRKLINKNKDVVQWQTFPSQHFNIDNGSDLLEDAAGRLWGYSYVIELDTKQVNAIGKSDGASIGGFWERAMLKTKSGTLIFGGVEGALLISPNNYEYWNYEPTTRITSLLVDNKVQEISNTASYTLPDGTSSVSFEFTSLDFYTTKNNHYRYKLAGYDSSWLDTNTDNRRATYTNLDPGKYTFQVKGSNSKGAWNNNDASIDIIQLPRWHQMLWFRVFMGVSIYLFLHQIYRFRTKQLRLVEKRLSAEVIERTKNIQQLAEIGKEITSSLDLDKIIEDVYKHINKLMDATVFGVGIFNGKKNIIEYKLSIESGHRYEPYIRSMDNKNQFAVRCIESKKLIISNDVSKEKKEFVETVSKSSDGVEGKMPNSIIYIPLIIDNKVLGLITVQSYHKQAYDQHHIDMLNSIASYTAVAIDNARAYQHIGTQNKDILASQKQLIQSSKMASIGTMTAGVAHEINNPTNFTHAAVYMMNEEINDIKSFLKQLAGGENAKPEVLQSFDDKFTKLIELTKTANEGTTRIKTIVEDLRTFSRIDDAKQAVVQLSDLLNSTVHLVQTQYDDIVIETQFYYEPSFTCFPSKLSQVFMNIIVNACQAIEAKRLSQKDIEGKVIITTVQSENKLVLSFKDNGCGMTEQTLNRIFEPFYTTKDVGVGTGLGMAISFGIIEEHDGSIDIESTVDRGTKVIISFDI